jgi:hypothetical protein
VKTGKVNWKHTPVGPDGDCIKVAKDKWDEVPELDETVKVTDGETERMGAVERIQGDRIYVYVW